MAKKRQIKGDSPSSYKFAQKQGKGKGGGKGGAS